jgi:hypothetical protein
VLRAAVAEFYFGAHLRQQFARGFDVAHLRDVFENYGLIREKGGSHGRQSCVLGAADTNGSQQRITATYYKLIHIEMIP